MPELTQIYRWSCPNESVPCLDGTRTYEEFLKAEKKRLKERKGRSVRMLRRKVKVIDYRKDGKRVQHVMQVSLWASPLAVRIVD